jgi:hypothetical protein
LIYGWNKSGKTTFSRAFVACEKRTTDFTNYPKDKDGNAIGEFEITIEGGTLEILSGVSETRELC